MKPRELERARRLLCALQDHIRAEVLRARRRGTAKFARVAAVTAADTIYQVDRISEDAILEWFAAHWPRAWPVELVMEGLEEVVTVPAGTPVERTVFKCILDPIDGTRNLMYDKRSAWILAGLAPQRGARTSLRDIVVAAMTEIPTTKQWRSDQLSAVRGAGLRAVAVDVRTGRATALPLRPSTARDCRGGFASVSRFFPEAKELLARLEEALWRSLYGQGGKGSPLVFEDQYISTGGQLYGLIAGHDRFLADLRPLAHAKLRLRSALVCHPYDVCVALLAREAGCVVESVDGPLDAPLDTTNPVTWVGYANASLARHIRPALRRVVKRYL